MIRLALLLALSYLLALHLFPQVMDPASSPWLRTAFLLDLCAGAVLFVALLRRVLA